MKTKKNIFRQAIGIFILLSFSGFTMNAQPEGQERMHKKHPPIPDSTEIVKIIDNLSKELSLTDDQTIKVTHLFKNHFSEVRTKIKGEKQKRDKHRQEMEELRKEFESNITKLLTKEQQEKFKEHQKKHHKKGGKKQDKDRK